MYQPDLSDRNNQLYVPAQPVRLEQPVLCTGSTYQTGTTSFMHRPNLSDRNNQFYVPARLVRSVQFHVLARLCGLCGVLSWIFASLKLCTRRVYQYKIKGFVVLVLSFNCTVHCTARLTGSNKAWSPHDVSWSSSIMNLPADFCLYIITSKNPTYRGCSVPILLNLLKPSVLGLSDNVLKLFDVIEFK